MDIFEFAMKMELDGKAYYEKLATDAKIEGFKIIFSRLAADEQKHYEKVKEIRAGSIVPMAETVILEDAKNIFQDLIGNEAIIAGMKDDLQAYEHAKDIEAESIKLYHGMAEKEQNPELARLFRVLAGEEKKHFNIMENIYDFVLRPKYYLEWREFSNLGQL